MPARKGAAAAAKGRALRSFCASDQGQARTNNEDRCFAGDEDGIYFVIDGVGGMAAGERAAELAETELLARLRRREDAPERRIREAIALAGKAIFEEAARNPDLKGMSCVLTVAVIEDGMVHIGHVGDSRMYLIAGDRIRKVTHDHSPVGQLEDAREISEEDAMRHPRRNEIFRDVGSQVRGPDDPNFIETAILQLPPDGALLLCSDGLSDELPSDRILTTALAHRGDPARVVRELIRLANEAGGRDNVSVVYVEAPGLAPGRSRGKSVLWRPVAPKSADYIDTVELERPEFEAPAQPRRAAGPPPAPRRARTAVLLLLAFALGSIAHYLYQTRFTPRSGPATLLVASAGAPHRTISGALEVAKPGDIVVVAPGIYLERLVLREGVHIVARPSGTARVQPKPDASETAPVIEARNLQHGSISGLTVAPAGEGGSPAGVLIENSGLEVLDIEVYGMREAGILVRGAGAAVVRGSHLHHNTGAAILVEAGATARILGNRILHNGGTEGTRPALLVEEGAAATVEGNWFAGNRANTDPKSTREAMAALEENNFFLRPSAPTPPRRGR